MARKHTSEKPPKKKPPKEPIDERWDLFEQFYKTYPRKIRKVAARQAWEKVAKKVAASPYLDWDMLINRMLKTIEAFKKTEQWTQNKGQFIPHPSTWLNGEGWLDEVEINVGKKQRTPPDWREVMRRF